MKPVVLESPYRGNIKLNKLYARFCQHDMLVNYGEAPYASHLLYTQEHVLRDEIPEERELGIRAGFVWREAADKTVFYIDLGLSEGMEEALEDCISSGKNYEERALPADVYAQFVGACSEAGIQLPAETITNRIGALQKSVS